MEYHIIINGEKSGPHPLDRLKMLGVGPDTYVWCQGMDDWAFAKDVAEVAAVIDAPVQDIPPFKPQQPLCQQTYKQQVQAPQGYDSQEYQHQGQDRPGYTTRQNTGNDGKPAFFNWLPLAIVATVLGSIIYFAGGIPGAIAIPKAIAARRAYNAGDYAAAAANNRIAMILSIVSGGIFAIFFTIVLFVAIS